MGRRHNPSSEGGADNMPALRNMERTEKLGYVEQRDLSFLAQAGGGAVFLSNKHIVLALFADLFCGESSADFFAVDYIEVHRRAFIFQLLQARKLFEVIRKMTHFISWHHPLLHFDILQRDESKKGGYAANVLQRTCKSNELKSIILAGATKTCYCVRTLRSDFFISCAVLTCSPVKTKWVHSLALFGFVDPRDEAMPSHRRRFAPRSYGDFGVVAIRSEMSAHPQLRMLSTLVRFSRIVLTVNRSKHRHTDF
jgi:hypothetical protein